MIHDVLAITGEPKGTVELPDAVFGQKVKKDLLWELTNYYLDAKRQGTASTKTRANVSGGGKKPWRQKHTGRARVGSTRSPIWRHGGIVFGPLPRDYSTSMPGKKREKALHVALSLLQKENRIRVVEDFDLPTHKTKDLTKILTDLDLNSKSTLMAIDKGGENLARAARNVANLTLTRVRDLNAYDVLRHKVLVFTRSAAGAVGAAKTGSEGAD